MTNFYIRGTLTGFGVNLSKRIQMFENKNQKPSPGSRTELSDLGEFALIDHLTENIQLQQVSTIKGVGDDAAVIDAGDKMVLVTTDLLIEGIHFDLSYMPLKHLGYKAAIVNFSDIAAMNGIPGQMTVSVAISNRFSVEALEELYSGIRLACDTYHVDLVGGDTSSSVKGLFLSITVIGTADKDDVIYRSGAKPGDLVCVTGDLGGAYIGLLILEREKSVYKANPDMQPELQGYEYPLGRQLKPEARTDLRDILREHEIRPTSMIDISDGLASEILHLCKDSGTGCSLYEEKIPIDPETRNTAMDFKIIPSVAALSGGEDYEILFTIKPSDYDKIKDIQGISVIGHMTEKDQGRWMITPDEKKVEITAQGWKAF